MNKLLNTLIIISFGIPIIFFSWVTRMFPDNYSVEMYGVLGNWTTGEMGYWHIYFILFGFALLFVKKSIIK